MLGKRQAPTRGIVPSEGERTRAPKNSKLKSAAEADMATIETSNQRVKARFQDLNARDAA